MRHWQAAGIRPCWSLIVSHSSRHAFLRPSATRFYSDTSNPIVRFCPIDNNEHPQVRHRAPEAASGEAELDSVDRVKDSQRNRRSIKLNNHARSVPGTVRVRKVNATRRRKRVISADAYRDGLATSAQNNSESFHALNDASNPPPPLHDAPSPPPPLHDAPSPPPPLHDAPSPPPPPADAAAPTTQDAFVSFNPSAASVAAKNISALLGEDGKPYRSDGDAAQTLEEAMMGAKDSLADALKTPKLTKRARRRILTGKKEHRSTSALDGEIGIMRPEKMTALDIEQPRVPRLFHGLDRVLFNRGVYQLQDPHSGVYNFDPYLQKIMPVNEFDFKALKEYKTSSQDKTLTKIALEHGKKYVGSTSSMTGTLAHFHYLLSAWRSINFGMLSRDFPEQSTNFTEINRAPNAIFLRWKNGTYAIDADKQYDGANVLMLLGKSMEKLLTMPTSDFERYRKSNPTSIPAEERNAPESYHYSTQGDFLMRSQLDAYDPRLPGTGMFDLKTRAVISIRMRAREYEDMSGYEIKQQQGQYESYEREYYDMMRSTALKYSLQARMGRMDGICLAYHNVKRIFGFQYMSLSELDHAIHGQSERILGNKEFALSIGLLNQVINKATEKYPEQSLRFHFEARPTTELPFMYIFAEPMAEDEINEIQNSQKEKIAEYERTITSAITESGDTEKTAPEPEDEETVRHDVVPDLRMSEMTDKAISRTGTISMLGTASQSEIITSEETESESKTLVASPSQPAEEEQDEEQYEKPLMAMILTVRSKVNGKYVERPQNLKPKDKWKIEYTLDEVEEPKRAWYLYKATKTRRAKVFEKLRKNDDREKDADGEQRDWNDRFIENLRELSRKGEKARHDMDLANKDKEKFVIGGPLPRLEGKNQDPDTTAEAGIYGVEDYMKWLCKLRD